MRWKDSKAVTVISSKYGLNPTAKAKQYIKEKEGCVDIEQPQFIKKYNEGMGGVDRLDQNIATYMIAHRSKKWWWPIFRFCVDLYANNAFQIYRHSKENLGQNPLDFLGFRRSIVDKYYWRYRKTTQIALFPGSRKETKVSDKVKSDILSSWTGKAKQGRCAECGKTTLYFCKKCIVVLHLESIKGFHGQW